MCTPAALYRTTKSGVGLQAFNERQYATRTGTRTESVPSICFRQFEDSGTGPLGRNNGGVVLTGVLSSPGLQGNRPPHTIAGHSMDTSEGFAFDARW